MPTNNTARRLNHDDAPHEDHSVRLAASWADYQRHLKLRGESARPRLTFDGEQLEIMAPSPDHETISRTIHDLVATYCQELDIDYTAVGSWTLNSKKLGVGLEPDECYVFGPRGRAKVPDLAIEVVWTSGGLDKLDIYRPLGVREIWVWQRGKVVPYVLRRSGYKPAARSLALPGIDLAELAACIGEPSTSAAVKRFRTHLRRASR
jgi:Uma2 family endonuclease